MHSLNVTSVESYTMLQREQQLCKNQNDFSEGKKATSLTHCTMFETNGNLPKPHVKAIQQPPFTPKAHVKAIQQPPFTPKPHAHIMQKDLEEKNNVSSPKKHLVIFSDGKLH